MPVLHRPPQTLPVAPDAGGPGEAPLPVTFVILTKDEERNLPACLDSLEGIADDVHVLDSGSRDRTVEVARSRGVPVHVNPFTGFGAQRNWAIDNLPHRHEWAFHLDADERFTEPLAAEIARVLAAGPREAGYFVPSKLVFGGRWLRRSGSYPAYQVRFFRRGRLRFADYGHGQREVADGPIGYLREPYLHDAFAKGLDDWFEKHVRYARREAEQHAGPGRCGLAAALSRDPVTRRRALKRLSHRLPGRSWLRFVEIYLLRGGFLDGRPGLAYAKMLAAYEAMAAAYAAAGRCGLRPDGAADEPLGPRRRPR